MIKILAVDDEPINQMIIAECLAEDGYQIDLADDGGAAWDLMQEKDYDLLILDRIMPILDGLSLLKRAKADERWKSVPVIMQTAAASEQQVREGIEAGAYYYLTKPYQSKVLRMLVSSVVEDVREKNRLKEAGAHLHTTLRLLNQGEFTFRSLEEARSIAAGISALCQSGDSAGMGLLELLVNAIEHGNLDISYAEKTQLRVSGQWEEEIARRLSCAPWKNRSARLVFRRENDEIEFTITDQGAGFDWRPFLGFDPERAFDPNGRGIAMAKMLGFSSLEYQGNGNCVVVRAAANRT
jgi:DNA-binding response OmpR family regulator